MKKNLLTVLILALQIVSIVLISVMMISIMNTNAKTAELVTNIATAVNLELTVPGAEEEETVSLADTQVYTLTGGMTIPLASEDGKQSYLVCDMALSLNMKHKDYKTYSETIAERETLIKDAITSVVMVHTQTECRNNMEGLKAEILEAVQELFQSDFIYDVAISEPKFG